MSSASRAPRFGRLLSTVSDTVRTELWPIPTIGVVLAVVAGLVLPSIDAGVDSGLPGWVSSVIFGGDPGAARTVLDAVSSSLITVTSLTFSLTVVTLQLASSQFSPRLLRTFTSDVVVQSTLGLFLATFSFSLTVLRRVRGASSSDAEAFVPRIAVSLAFLLAVASVLALVAFLAHLARQIRVETMLRNVHQDASATAEVALTERGITSTVGLDEFEAQARSALVLSVAGSGFLTFIDERALLRSAGEAGAGIEVDAQPGTFVVAGVPVGRAWPLLGDAFDDGTARQLQDAVSQSLHTGFERTASQDVGYGLRQLTDVANKALSPGINDPSTAVYALRHSSALLCELVGRDLGPLLLRDEDDAIRVLWRRPAFCDLLDLAMTQPRRYGASDAQVLNALTTMLGDLSHHVPVDQLPVLEEQLSRLAATVAAQDFDTQQEASLGDHSAEVAALLRRRLRDASSVDAQGPHAAQSP